MLRTFLPRVEYTVLWRLHALLHSIGCYYFLLICICLKQQTLKLVQTTSSFLFIAFTRVIFDCRWVFTLRILRLLMEKGPSNPEKESSPCSARGYNNNRND